MTYNMWHISVIFYFLYFYGNCDGSVKVINLLVVLFKILLSNTCLWSDVELNYVASIDTFLRRFMKTTEGKGMIEFSLNGTEIQ